jgi:DNA-binding Lrp family transcriptional regulator
MELKPIDYKLIEYLFHHARAPASKIAKNTGLSRDQVNYRINRYIEEGIIKKFEARNPKFETNRK